MPLTKVTSGMRTLGTGEIVTANLADSAITTAKMATDPTNASNLSSGSVPVGQLGNAPATDITGLEQDIALLGFELASTQSLAQYDLQGQTVDSFTDESGIDTSASSNQVYDSTNKRYTTVGVGSKTFLEEDDDDGVQSSMLSSSGFTTISTSCLTAERTDYYANCCLSDGIGAGAYWQLDFGSGNEKRITQFGMFLLGQVYLLFGTIKHSDDGSTWTSITPSTGLGGNPTTSGQNGTHITTSEFNTGASGVKKRYWRLEKQTVQITVLGCQGFALGTFLIW